MFVRGYFMSDTSVWTYQSSPLCFSVEITVTVLVVEFFCIIFVVFNHCTHCYILSHSAWLYATISQKYSIIFLV